MLRIAREKNMNPESIVDFASSINPFPPQDLFEVVSKASKYILYYPNNSYDSLVDAITSFLDCERNEVVFGNGSIELIRGFFALHYNRKVLIPYPTFTEYERFARIYGMEIVSVPLNISLIVHTIEEEKPDAIILCNPNNPTGDLVERKEMQEIAELCERYGISMLLDEAFMDFVGEGFSGEAFIARSLTKILAIPGLRFGYGRFPRSYADKFHKTRDPWNVNVIAMRVAEHYLPLLNKFSKKIRKRVAKEREWLKRELENAGFEANGSANFLLVKSKLSSKQIFEMLIDRNILIRECSDFRGLDKNYFRIAVKRRKDNAILIEALKHAEDLLGRDKFHL